MELPTKREMQWEETRLYIIISFIDRPQSNYTHENQRNVTWKIRKQRETSTYIARLRKVRFNPIPGKKGRGGQRNNWHN